MNNLGLEPKWQRKRNPNSLVSLTAKAIFQQGVNEHSLKFLQLPHHFRRGLVQTIARKFIAETEEFISTFREIEEIFSNILEERYVWESNRTLKQSIDRYIDQLAYAKEGLIALVNTEIYEVPCLNHFIHRSKHIQVDLPVIIERAQWVQRDEERQNRNGQN